MVFRNNSLDTTLAKNVALISINGIPIQEIISRLKSHMVRDGNAASHSFKGIEQSFSNAYSNFIDNPQTFKIQVQEKGGESYSIEIEGLTMPEIDSIRRNRYEISDPPKSMLKFVLIDSLDAAVFTIRSFNNQLLKAFNQEFLPFSDSVFRVLKEQRMKKLIIDLRGNVGGWTANGRDLFSYFISDTTAYIKRVETKLNNFSRFAPIIVDYPDYPDTAKFELNVNGIYSWQNYPSLIAVPKSKEPFGGKTFILIDDMTRSCSSVFTTLMVEHTNAVIVGEENGATICGSSAMIMSFRLPNSGITVYTSTAKYSSAVEDSLNSRGITPHIAIEPSTIDLAIDSVLNNLND